MALLLPMMPTNSLVMTRRTYEADAEHVENSKSQEDKITAVRVVSNQDSQKATNAIKSLMKKT